MIIGAVVLVLLVGLGIGGYFLVIKVDEVHDENVSNLAAFGSVVTPVRAPNYGEDGEQTGLAPTIGDPNLSATDKIIVSLSKEKQTLIKELSTAKARINELEDQVALLNTYKETNERYAPRLMTEERNYALKTMTEYLDGSDDATQFNQFQRDAMAQISANVYVDLVRRFHLNITDEQRKQLLSDYLPAYAFCVGKDIGFVANSRQEETRLLNYLKTGDKTVLADSLLNDVETINAPCLAALNERVLPFFRADLK